MEKRNGVIFMKKTLTLMGLIFLSFSLLSCKTDINKLNFRYSGSTKEKYYLVSGNKSKAGITNTNVEIPEIIKSSSIGSAIDTDGFRDAKDLISVKLAINTRYIFNNAFSNSSLTTIEIPENSILEIIDGNAFNKTNISKIFIPSSVRLIEKNAFEDILDLTIFTKHSFDTDVFDKIKMNNLNIKIIFECDYNDYLNF